MPPNGRAHAASNIKMARLVRALVIAACLTGPTSSIAQGSPAECGGDRFPAPTLCARARLDTLRASYLLLVDESGSMQSRWSTVQSAVSEFVAAIPDGDELEVRVFAGRVRTLIPARPASERVRADWRKTLGELRRPTGASTDLGAAAGSAVELLRAAPADRLLFVFLLTDGQHQPAVPLPTSGFPAEWSDKWQQLANEAASLTAVRPVSTTLLRLSADADRSMLARVFPGLIVADATGPEALRAWFANARREVSVGKLRLAIDHELKHPAWVFEAGDLAVASGTRTTHDVRVRSQRRIVGVQPANGDPLDLPGGGGGGRGGRIVLPRPMPNDSGQTVRVEITGPRCGWWRPPGACGTVAPAGIRLATVLEPGDELRRIGVDPGPRPDSIALNFKLESGGALQAKLYYPLAAVLALALAFLAISVKWAMHQPKLFGRLVYTPTTGSTLGVDDRQTIRLNEQRGRSYTLKDRNGTEIVRFDAKAKRGKSKIDVTPCPPNVHVRVNGKPYTSHRLERTTRIETPQGDIQYYSS